ncbi:MAG: hypothetical protein VW057_14075 [Rhodospirillaceae bacterium]
MSQHEKYLNLSFLAAIPIIAGISLFFVGLYKATANRSFSLSHAIENIPSMTTARPSRPAQKTAYRPLKEGQEIANLVFAAHSSPDISAVTDLRFAHHRTGSILAGKGRTIGHSSLEVRYQQSNSFHHQVTFRLSHDRRHRTVGPLSTNFGNPLIWVHLESTTRTISALTGVSPVYIRDRLKTALRASGVVQPITAVFGMRQIQAREIILKPFRRGPLDARLGAFAKLQLRFQITDAVQGNFLKLIAETPPNADGSQTFQESLILQPAP